MKTLGKIIAAPDDLSLRQVYADELIEAGNPRGTFIAHQLAQEQLDPLDERYAPMIASSRRLELKHRGEWLADFLKRLKTKNTPSALRELNPIFRGGFLERIALSVDQIEEHWPWLREREPIGGIELLIYEHLPPEFRELKEPKSFRTLTLTVDGWFTANSAGNVLAWGMPLLRELDLSRAAMGFDGGVMLANGKTDLASVFEDFVDPPPFTKGQLKRLELAGCGLTDEGVQALLAADHLTALETLNLNSCGIADKATWAALKKASAINATLQRFNIGGNKVALGELAGWEALPKLTGLALPQSVTQAEFAKLFPKPSPKLRELDVRSAKELMTSPERVFEAAEHFTSLHIGTTSLGEVGFERLLASKSMETLFHLQANGCGLSDASMTALTKSKLKRLVTLDVSSNKLTDAGLQTLMSWKGAELLTHLRISNNRKVTLKGYEALINAKDFDPALLDVGKVSDAKAKKALAERFGDALLISS
ncbi:MAG: hypothetical protein JNM17_29175 [Archangium sp.]|nr:hypothetical protein [Archangium sp.]